jgi:hypothetical protein
MLNPDPEPRLQKKWPVAPANGGNFRLFRPSGPNRDSRIRMVKGELIRLPLTVRTGDSNKLATG